MVLFDKRFFSEFLDKHDFQVAYVHRNSIRRRMDIWTEGQQIFRIADNTSYSTSFTKAMKKP